MGVGCPERSLRYGETAAGLATVAGLCRSRHPRPQSQLRTFSFFPGGLLRPLSRAWSPALHKSMVPMSPQIIKDLPVW